MTSWRFGSITLVDAEGKETGINISPIAVKLIGENGEQVGLKSSELKTEDVNTFLLRDILVELKLMNLKLNCLQPDDEELDASDLDDLEQE